MHFFLETSRLAPWGFIVSMPDTELKIGFPPPFLGEAPVRLAVLGQGDGWLALEKPPGVAIDAHPLLGDAPTLVGGINKQLEATKPELLRLGLEKVFAVYPLDIELSGIALLAWGREGVDRLRNTFGSSKLQFTFTLLAIDETPAAGDARTCDLPLAPAQDATGVTVSHTRGKKCTTAFTLVERLGAHILWRAQTDYLRPHQIRCHAMETGLRIIGDPLYGAPAIPGPAHGLCLHLETVTSLSTDLPVAATTPMPKPFEKLLRRLRRRQED